MATPRAEAAVEQATPDVAAPQKGRKSARAQVSLIARYRSPTAFEFVQEECCDLSAGGMFIKSPAPAPAGTLIKLECDVGNGAQTIRGVARVVWLRDIAGEGQPTGMGVKFVKLEGGGREALQAVLEQLGADKSDPPDAELRRSLPPKRPSPPPTPVAASHVPEVAPTATEDGRRAAAVAPVPPPRPPASSDKARAAAGAPQRAIKNASARIASAPAKKNLEPGGGLRTLGFAAIVALAVVVIYVTQGTRAPAVPAAKLPAPTQPPAAVATQPVSSAQSTETAATQPAPELTYVLEVVTTPEGARVTAGEQALIAPGTLELGALAEPLQLKVEKPGFQAASAVVDRVGFMLDEGRMRRRIALTLVEEPKPEAVPEAPAPQPRKAAPNAQKTPKAKPSQRVVSTAGEANAKQPEPPPETANAEPLPEATRAGPAKPDPAAAPPKASGKLTPMETAAACLATGNNVCVVKALEGKAKSASEFELLIETYRALGDTAKAEKQMQLYVNKYPNERHANGYRRVLERRQSEAASTH